MGRKWIYLDELSFPKKYPNCVSMRIKEVRVEKWGIECLWGYLEEIGYEPSGDEIEDEEFWWMVLEEAIEHYKRRDGWNFYIYIPPEDCGEMFGMTIWYSLIG